MKFEKQALVTVITGVLLVSSAHAQEPASSAATPQQNIKKLKGAKKNSLIKPLADTAPEADTSFVIRRFEITGPELVPRADLQAALADFLNKPLTFNDLRSATQALEKVHVNAGFEVVRAFVPEQEIDGSGVLKLSIIDARLDSVSVTGNKAFPTENIIASLPVLAKGSLLNTAALDKGLRLANDSNAKQVQVGLVPSDKSGLVDANIRVTDESPQKTYLTLDNTGTHSTGRFRVGAVYQHANLFNRDHALTLQALTSPDNHLSDVRVFGLGYRIPFYQWGGALEGNINYSSVNAGVIAAGGSVLGISGKGKLAGLKWVQVLPRAAGWDQRLAASAEYKLFESSVTLSGTSGSLIPDLETRPVGLTYSASYRDSNDDAFISAGTFRNISTGGRNSTASYQQPGGRANATGGFSVARLNAAWTRRFSNHWAVRLESNAQFTSDALIPSEQFGAGGAYSVRGFNERELAQDQGVRESIEVTTPDLHFASAAGRYLRLAVFADAAQLKRNKAVAGELERQSVASYGAGVRYSFKPGQNLRLDVTRVLRGDNIQPNGDVMIHFSFAMAL